MTGAGQVMAWWWASGEAADILSAPDNLRPPSPSQCTSFTILQRAALGSVEKTRENLSSGWKWPLEAKSNILNLHLQHKANKSSNYSLAKNRITQLIN